MKQPGLTDLDDNLLGAILSQVPYRSLACFRATSHWAYATLRRTDATTTELLDLVGAYTLKIAARLDELKHAVRVALEAWRPGQEPFSKVLRAVAELLKGPGFNWTTDPLPEPLAVHPTSRRPAYNGVNYMCFSSLIHFWPPLHCYPPLEFTAVVCSCSPFLSCVQVSLPLNPRWVVYQALSDPPRVVPADPTWPSLSPSSTTVPPMYRVAKFALQHVVKRANLHTHCAGHRLLG